MLLFAGGHIVIATWCQREETPDKPFTGRDKAALQFLYDEWAHPYFVSVQEYGRLLEVSISLAPPSCGARPCYCPTWKYMMPEKRPPAFSSGPICCKT